MKRKTHFSFLLNKLDEPIKMTLQNSVKSNSPDLNHSPPLTELAKEEFLQSNDRNEKESGKSEKLDITVAPLEGQSKGPVICDSLLEDSGRERLKQHRIAVAGHVWIPEKWGKEDLLKDWIDSSAFEASLFPSGFVSAHSARVALVREGKRANNNDSAGGLRILNRC